MNQVALVGRTTTDIELRSTMNGKHVTSFTLAVSRDKDNTDFITCNAWEKTAEVLAQYTHKGSQIGIEGSLQQRKWQTQSGENRYALEVLVRRIQLLDPKQSNTEQSYNQNTNTYGQSYQAQQQSKTSSYEENLDIDSDDLPF